MPKAKQKPYWKEVLQQLQVEIPIGAVIPTPQQAIGQRGRLPYIQGGQFNDIPTVDKLAQPQLVDGVNEAGQTAAHGQQGLTAVQRSRQEDESIFS